MRAALALVLLAATPSGAAAKCHHFSRWHFPYPQHCEVRLATRAALQPWRAPAQAPPPAPAVRLPARPVDDAALRAVAIAEAREALALRAAQRLK